MSVANTSQHLQRLKQAGLVTSERKGLSVLYRVADPAVIGLWVELRTVAAQQLAEIERVLDRYRPQRQRFPTVSLEQLQTYLQQGQALLLDVRPAQEYAAGHLPGALSLSLDQLAARLALLPRDKLLITYCRGPLCVYADQALEVIAASGRRGARLEEGVAEWQLAGYDLEHSSAA